MKEQKILWLRELSCGHTRPTNIAFMMGNYDKPDIKKSCFCRECNENVKVIKITENKDKELEKELNQMRKKLLDK